MTTQADTIASILAMIDAGVRYQDIAKEYGLHVNTIGSVARLHGIKRMGGPSFDQKRNETILAMVDAGVPYQRIGIKFGITRARVQQIAVLHGVERKRGWKSR